MKPICYILIFSLLSLMGCGEMGRRSSFSKRKYLKKPPKQRYVEKVIGKETEVYASTELAIEYIIDSIPKLNYEEDILQKKEENIVIPSLINLPNKHEKNRNFSNFSKHDIKYNNQKQSKSKKVKWFIIAGYILIYISVFFGGLALMTIVWGDPIIAGYIAMIALSVALAGVLLVTQT